MLPIDGDQMNWLRGIRHSKKYNNFVSIGSLSNFLILLSKSDTQRTNNLLGISKSLKGLDVALHSWNPSTGDMKVGESGVESQPCWWVESLCGLQCVTMSKTNKKRNSSVAETGCGAQSCLDQPPILSTRCSETHSKIFSFLLPLWDSVFLSDCLELIL